ncbi:Splicing factor-like protein [Parasponia andersonii]|uniref:Splicing factor-like protein n=1 Tax=Parasponia andersonii TaxID=3476 RepID=A0A2P5ACG5_PARAD|nr:Splicing factor-like protein [Parasponia andersonii]
MGAKAKKALKKSLRKASSSTPQKEEAVDFLPLEGGPGLQLPVEKPTEDISKVVYIGRIPHGFYEKEMEGFFRQFGVIKRLRIARNKKSEIRFASTGCVSGLYETGKSKHYGFIEFEDPGVAKVVAETMNNYLLYEHLLQVHLVPPERIHPKLWRGFNICYKPLDWVKVERKRHDKERTLEERKKLVDKIVKRDEKRRKRIEAAGIDYECPEIVGNVEPLPKKIRFE